MGFRFWKRFKVLPGVTVNVSKSGPSVSLGPRGAKVTVGRRGVQGTAGIPGSGLFYTKKLLGLGELLGGGKEEESKPKKGKQRDRPDELPPPPPPPPPPESPEDRALIEACRELEAGRTASALEHLRGCARVPDGAFLAGLAALNAGELAESERWLTEAVRRHPELGQTLSRLGIEAEQRLPVTEEVTAVVGPSRAGALLGLVEVYQLRGRHGEAIAALRQLRDLEPDDPVIRLSLMELLAEAAPDDKETWQELVQLAQGIEDESPVHAAILLYKARALRELGLLEAARDTLTGALRKKKGRPEPLRLALRYERALVYEALGQGKRSRSDLEKIYAASPSYEDVPQRLGL